MAGGKRRNPSDRISNLPENITKNIIGRLAIQDLVRTSVLSRNWRYKWTTLPDLVFDALTLPSQFQSNENKLVRLVYNILRQHKCPIIKFSLSIELFTTETNYVHINRWIKHLSGDRIFREFILEFTYGSRYRIPYCLFSCVNLRKLKLQSCIIPSPPPTIFNGFNALTRLELERVTFSNEGFQNLITKCPQLTHLLLFSIDGIDRLNIVHAPKLKLLYFVVKLIKSISLEYTPNLSVASLYSYQPPRNGDSMTYNLNSVYNLRKFVLGSYFLKSLSQYRLPSTFQHLSEVGLVELMFQDIDSMSSALDLIKRSPNLRRLVVTTALDAKSSAAAQLKMVTKCLEEKSGSIGSLNELRYVEWKNMTGLGPEMLFIKMILCNSPLLMQMEIQHAQSLYPRGVKEILKELLRFPRASAMAEIMYRMAGCNRRKSSDRISNLPENITKNILSRLTIQDVVRTSVLSRNWRYKWTTLPDLVFDALNLPSKIHNDENKLVGLVYNILLQHNGPISKFSLSIKSISETNYFHINRWIKHYLSGDAAGALRTFILEFTNESRFEIPCSLFSCVNLRILKLRSCILPSPPTIFNGFKKLTHLELKKVTFNNEGLESLIFINLPQLIILKLCSVDGIDRLNIVHAPKLNSLYISAKRIKFVSLEYAPNLTQLYCYLNQNLNLGDGESTSLTNNLNPLSNTLRKCVLGSYFLKALPLPSTFFSLSEVRFCPLMFQDMDSVCSALDLITRSPNLRKLVVTTALHTKSFEAAQLETETVTKCLEERSGSICSLNKLRYVKMKNMTGLGLEMQFIQMILCNSPLLKKMKIQPAAQSVYTQGVDGILKGLLQFSRASPMVEIIFKRKAT